MLLKNGKIVTGKGINEIDLRIEGEKIAELAEDLQPLEQEKVIDLKGRFVFPGIIDSHTHFQLYSRGTVTADDFYYGSRSAAFGGVTTIIDYADQEDGSLLKGLEERKLQAGEAVIDYNLHLTINNSFKTGENMDELSGLKEAGVTSLKIFTTYKDIYMIEESKLAPLFKAASEAELLITVHAEDDEIISRNEEVYRKSGRLGPAYHADIRPGAAEGEAVKVLLEKVREVDSPLYIVHLSSKEGYAQVERARKGGLKIYAETTPHYLLLTRELLEGETGYLNLMTPPLRDQEDNRVLWQGVTDEDIDVIATDHCAFSPEQKKKGNNSLDIFPGIAGVETLLPLIYTYGVKKGKISLSRMIELLSTNPARIFGLYPRKGTIQVGTDADLVIYDPEKEWKLQGEHLHSRAGYTPFQGMKIRGKVDMTFLRGKMIVKGDEFLAEKGYGRFLQAGSSSVFD